MLVKKSAGKKQERQHRRLVLLIILFMAAASSLAAGLLAHTPTQSRAQEFSTQPLPLGQSGNWQLVFSDEFDGTALDSSKWVTCFPWGTQAGCGSTTTPDLWYLPQNVVVSSGTAKLRALNQQVTGTDGKTYSYASGIITTSKFYNETGS